MLLSQLQSQDVAPDAVQAAPEGVQMLNSNVPPFLEVLQGVRGLPDNGSAPADNASGGDPSGLGSMPTPNEGSPPTLATLIAGIISQQAEVPSANGAPASSSEMRPNQAVSVATAPGSIQAWPHDGGSAGHPSNAGIPQFVDTPPSAATAPFPTTPDPVSPEGIFRQDPLVNLVAQQGADEPVDALAPTDASLRQPGVTALRPGMPGQTPEQSQPEGSGLNSQAVPRFSGSERVLPGTIPAPQVAAIPGTPSGLEMAETDQPGTAASAPAHTPAGRIQTGPDAAPDPIRETSVGSAEPTDGRRTALGMAPTTEERDVASQRTGLNSSSVATPDRAPSSGPTQTDPQNPVTADHTEAGTTGREYAQPGTPQPAESAAGLQFQATSVNPSHNQYVNPIAQPTGPSYEPQLSASAPAPPEVPTQGPEATRYGQRDPVLPPITDRQAPAVASPDPRTSAESPLPTPTLVSSSRPEPSTAVPGEAPTSAATAVSAQAPQQASTPPPTPGAEVLAAATTPQAQQPTSTRPGRDSVTSNAPRLSIGQTEGEARSAVEWSPGRSEDHSDVGTSVNHRPTADPGAPYAPSAAAPSDAGPHISSQIDTAVTGTADARPVVQSTTQATQASAQTSQAPGLPEDPSAVTDQVVRAARLASRDGSNEVTVRLDPPELGKVTVRLVSEDRVLSGQIVVENRQVHDLVQGRMTELRESLSAQGVQVDQIQVTVDGRGASGTQREANQYNLREEGGNARPDDQESSQRGSDRWENASRQYGSQPDGSFDTTA
jgi:flagellar hook-length control protein FliK